MLEKRVARELTMNRLKMGWVVVCLLGLVGCTIERYDDDCDDYGDDYGDDGGRGHGAAASGGKSATAGAGNASSSAGTASSAGTTSAGGSAAQGAAAGTGAPPPEPCTEERDCAPGYNCDASSQQCLPSEQETCGELASEQACSNRRDCVAVYGGLNCSCGADCECQGGEPGCVCETFEFFACKPGE